ncbi:dihydroorotase [Aerosakkonema funiforme]|uniref:Dihydroorotase n=2 Tax=Oscillatoriophycideae TaxID=1301283 RepID=A0A926ZKQ9_9CYAN|nr:dihydroorotase [Aerosakkonema funiforme]MBD2184251.1 dihydroorotase [Aerosakkonema funiforme FACHB-1375]
MTNSELLQQVRVIDPVSGTDQIADVLIANGTIEAVEENISKLPSKTSVRDCRGLVLGPGLVDLYSHSGEPGFEERETLPSLIQAARSGGFTRVAILPNTTPPLDNPAGLARLQRLAGDITDKLSVPPPLYFWGAITLGVQGQQMTELAELADSGIVGFTDGQPLQNLALVRRLLEYLKTLSKPIALWPEYRELAGNGVMREGINSIRLGLPGNPSISETAALAALLEVVEAVGTPVHIMRVSTGRSVQLIWEAKVRGLPITASTTWMHLLLDTEAISSYNTSLRLSPPLGSPADRAALKRGVQQGIIDAIAIDHTPYSYEEKTVAFGEAPPGAIGLELALPLLWQNLVETGEWSALELWRVLSTQPAVCLKQIPAAIAPGQPAEVILFDPQLTWKVQKQNLKSLSYNTPWLGQDLIGRVIVGVRG